MSQKYFYIKSSNSHLVVTVSHEDSDGTMIIQDRRNGGARQLFYFTEQVIQCCYDNSAIDVVRGKTKSFVVSQKDILTKNTDDLARWKLQGNYLIHVQSGDCLHVPRDSKVMKKPLVASKVSDKAGQQWEIRYVVPKTFYIHPKGEAEFIVVPEKSEEGAVLTLKKKIGGENELWVRSTSENTILHFNTGLKLAFSDKQPVLAKEAKKWYFTKEGQIVSEAKDYLSLVNENEVTLSESGNPGQEWTLSWVQPCKPEEQGNYIPPKDEPTTAGLSEENEADQATTDAQASSELKFKLKSEDGTKALSVNDGDEPVGIVVSDYAEDDLSQTWVHTNEGYIRNMKNNLVITLQDDQTLSLTEEADGENQKWTLNENSFVDKDGNDLKIPGDVKLELERLASTDSENAEGDDEPGDTFSVVQDDKDYGVPEFKFKLRSEDGTKAASINGEEPIGIVVSDYEEDDLGQSWVHTKEGLLRNMKNNFVVTRQEDGTAILAEEKEGENQKWTLDGTKFLDKDGNELKIPGDVKLEFDFGFGPGKYILARGHEIVLAATISSFENQKSEEPENSESREGEDNSESREEPGAQEEEKPNQEVVNNDDKPNQQEVNNDDNPTADQEKETNNAAPEQGEEQNPTPDQDVQS